MRRSDYRLILIMPERHVVLIDHIISLNLGLSITDSDLDCSCQSVEMRRIKYCLVLGLLLRSSFNLSYKFCVHISMSRWAGLHLALAPKGILLMVMLHSRRIAP